MDTSDELREETLPNNASEALLPKKKCTVRNHPFWCLVLVVSIIVGFVGTYSLVTNMLNPRSVTSNALHVLVEGKDVSATVVRMDVIDPENQSLVFGHEALMIVLSKSEESPQLKLTKQPVDVLWINEAFSVVSFERNATPETTGLLQAPSTADYALVSRVGLLPEGAFEEGKVVYIADKTKLQ